MGVSELFTLTEVKEKEQRLYCCSVWSSVTNTYLILSVPSFLLVYY